MHLSTVTDALIYVPVHFLWKVITSQYIPRQYLTIAGRKSTLTVDWVKMRHLHFYQWCMSQFNNHVSSGSQSNGKVKILSWWCAWFPSSHLINSLPEQSFLSRNSTSHVFKVTNFSSSMWPGMLVTYQFCANLECQGPNQFLGLVTYKYGAEIDDPCLHFLHTMLSI